MTKMSLMDKLAILLDVIKTSKLCIIVFFVLLFIGYMLVSKSNNMKSKKRVSLVAYLSIIGIIIYIYRNNLGNMFDYMMNNLFIIIYFPNLDVYLAAIIITNIILWVSIFNSKMPVFIKKINVTIYCMITYLMVLVLKIISENNLDVFTQSSVYGNSNAQALIELSSTIFIVWIAFLLIYKVIKSLIIKPKPVPVQKRIEKQVVKKVVQKPYRQIQPPYIVKANTNTIKVEKTNETKQYDDLLTLDDYKLLLNILKEQKAKEQQEKDRQARIDKEQEKYRELQELYRSVI